MIMKKSNDYLELNKDAWNKKTGEHIHSAFYDVENFKKGKSSLNEIELDLLGNIANKDLLHLQCHFGQDSLSLARMGAKVTGVDLSNKAIEEARKLSSEIDTPADFIESDVYTVQDKIPQTSFDLVYSTYGTITWLPDMDKWAKVVKQMLRPGGKLILVEFHPFIWTFDDQMKTIAYHYFNEEEIVEITEGTYTDRNAPIKTETVSWNHSLDEVIGSLLCNGFSIQHFKEYDYSPYPCFPNVEEFQPKRFRFKHIEKRIPMIYSIIAEKLG